MDTDIMLEELHARIEQLKETAEELKRMGEAVPSVKCNTARILASIKMLELGVSDLANL